MRLDTKFNLQDRVTIIELETVGKVLGIYVESKSSIQYKVRYFYNGEAKTVFFFESELYECLT